MAFLVLLIVPREIIHYDQEAFTQLVAGNRKGPAEPELGDTKDDGPCNTLAWHLEKLKIAFDQAQAKHRYLDCLRKIVSGGPEYGCGTHTPDFIEEYLSRFNYGSGAQHPYTINDNVQLLRTDIVGFNPVHIWGGIGSPEPFFDRERVVEGGVLRRWQFTFEAKPGNIQDIDHHCQQQLHDIDFVQAVLDYEQKLRHWELFVKSGLIETLDDRFGCKIEVQPGLSGGWQGDQFAPLHTKAIDFVNIVAYIVHCIFDKAVHHLNLAGGTDPQHKPGTGTVQVPCSFEANPGLRPMIGNFSVLG